MGLIFSDSTVVAEALGYLIGTGSLLLYTPIAIRLLRQKSAEGLVQSTWWLKLSSYVASDIYGITHGYPISTYIETLIITVQAAVILFLVAYYQRLMNPTFWRRVAIFVSIAAALLLAAPTKLIAMGQGISAILNTSALIPQFILNHKRQEAGDYSPITAGLAAAGCLARIFTTVQLADTDRLLIATFTLAFAANAALLSQIIYLGMKVEGRTLRDVLTADSGRFATQPDPVETEDCDPTPYHQQEEDITPIDVEEDSPLTVRRQSGSHRTESVRDT